MPNADFLAIVKSQYGAALTMFDAALQACPPEQWDNPAHTERFWNTAYHTLYFTDLYLGLPGQDMVRQPFDYESAHWMPGQPHEIPADRTVITKEDMLTYAAFVRERLDTVMNRLAGVDMEQPCPFTWLDMTIPECLLYNLRHLQHHASQMLLLMQQEKCMDPAGSWSSKG